MKRVREVVADLLKEDQEAFVVMSKDEEGNAFGPLYEHGAAWFVPDGRDSYLWQPDPDEGPVEEQQPPEEAVRVVCLWP